MITFLMDINDVKTRNKLEDIYTKYKQDMYYIAFKILNNVHDAQDVVQSSILKLVNYLGRIEDIECSKTKALVTTIVRNGAIDLYRRKQKHSFMQLDKMGECIVDESASLDEMIILIGEAKWLAERLSELNTEYAEILTLKYYYEFTDSEIAELLNIRHQNVRTRLHRAKKSLKKLIEKNNEMQK